MSDQTGNLAAPQPMIEEGAPEKTVTIKPRWWEPDDNRPTDFTLRPRRFATDAWEAFLPDGSWIGTVERYTGSLDRKSGRLRIEGKRRTLWAYRSPGSRHTMWEEVSRADCLRSLLDSHRRRNA